MSSWSSFTKEAEKGTGFSPVAIPDDLYNAEIIAVGEPYDVADIFAKEPGKMKTQFTIDWAIEGEDVPEDASLRQWVSLPEAYINSGFLHEKATIYQIMDALGFDMNGRFRVDPPSWVGKRARVMVENSLNKEGDPRPKITDVKPLRRRAEAPAKRNRDLDGIDD